MWNVRRPLFKVFALFFLITVILWASGIVPQVYQFVTANGGSANQGNTLNFGNTSTVTWSCSTTLGVTTCSATASGAGPTLETNGSNNSSQTVLNLINSVTNAIGLACTASNTTGGTVKPCEITGTLSVSGGGTGDTSFTAYAPVVGGTSSTGALQSAGAGTAGQVFLSQGSSTKPSYSDFPERYMIPAANCNNTTPGAAWSIGSGGTVACRGGTNNLGGYVTITDTSSTFAQFVVSIPDDWDSSTDPYIRIAFAAASDTTSGHTIIPQIKVSCPSAINGTVSDDATFSAAQSLSTTTIGASAVANGFYAGSNVQIGSTQMSGCIAGGMMIVQVGRATDTATGNINFYWANLTFPRLLVVQAN